MANRILTKEEFSRCVAEGYFDALVEHGDKPSEIKDLFHESSWNHLKEVRREVFEREVA